MVTEKSSPRDIRLDPLGLGEILNRHLLKVPLNQRNYAWEDEYVVRLFTDFTKAFNDGGDYFVGSIVTIPKDSNILEVVDGQQRLATTAILITAIRDYLVEIKEERLAASITTDFLSAYDRRTKEETTHLRLNVDDNELFSKILTDTVTAEDKEAARGSRRLLLDAYAYARRHVEQVVGGLAVGDHADQLNRWIEFIQYKTLAILLQVAHDADAFRMFETLNDRGLRTSQSDLVKNYLYESAEDRIDEVQARWTVARAALESLDDEDLPFVLFLRHGLINIRGYLREADIYDAVQEEAKSPQGAVTLADRLAQLSTVYVSLPNPEHDRWDGYSTSVARAIEVFNLINIKPMRPLQLAIAAKLDPKEAEGSFDFLVSLGVRLMIASSTRSGSVEQPLANAAKEVFDGAIGTAADLKNELAAITPTDDEFRAAFAVTRSSNPRLARYYLRSLELASQDEAEPWFIPNEDPKAMTLDHILPQNPEGNWPNFDQAAVSSHVKRLGNMALLPRGENSGVKSEGFDVKKPIFEKAPYATTSTIAEFDDWTTEAIESRQEDLAELALKAWPI